jgi:hypothetical protein
VENDKPVEIYQIRHAFHPAVSVLPPPRFTSSESCRSPGEKKSIAKAYTGIYDRVTNPSAWEILVLFWAKEGKK